MIGLQSDGSVATFAAFPKYLDHSNTAVSVSAAESSFTTKRHYWYNGTGVGSLFVVGYDLATGMDSQQAGVTATLTTSAQIVCVSGPTSGVMPTTTTSISSAGPDGTYWGPEYGGQNQHARFVDAISGAWLNNAGISLTDSFSIALEMKNSGHTGEVGASKSWFIWGL